MSLWRWLIGRRQRIEEPDVIWMTDRNRMEGVCSCIQEKLSECRLILVTSHFSERLEELRRLLDRDSIPYRNVETTIRSDQIFQQLAPQGRSTVLLASAARLEASDKPDLGFDSPDRVMVLAIERHPLGILDAQINRFAEALACQFDVQYFVSLDDVLMKLFAGARVREILQKLGMQDDESISSAMVSRRLRDAQRKVENRYEAMQGMLSGTALERASDGHSKVWNSAEEWMAAHGLEVESAS